MSTTTSHSFRLHRPLPTPSPVASTAVLSSLAIGQPFVFIPDSGFDDEHPVGCTVADPDDISQNQRPAGYSPERHILGIQHGIGKVYAFPRDVEVTVW